MHLRVFAKPAVVVAAVAAVLLGPVAPAVGAAPGAPGGLVVELLRPVPPPPASATYGTLPVAEGNGLEAAGSSRQVAPGIRLTSYNRPEFNKPLRYYALSVDLTAGTRVDYLNSAKVAARKPLSQLAAEHDPGAGRRTVAAINGDFFDINQTGAPQGPGISAGHLVNSPITGANNAVGVSPGAGGRILKLYFDGTLTLPRGRHVLGSLNAANVPAGGIGAYTAQWGAADRALTVDGAKRAAEVAVVAGRVASAAGSPGRGEIPDGTTVLVGRDAGADVIAGLRLGDQVSMAYHPRAGSGAVPRTAVGGRELLVVDGTAVSHEGEANNATAPRTAVGFSRDGRTMYVLTVDGRQAGSAGVTLTELGLMMQRAGSVNALNLDGGGSTTLVARAPDSDTLRVENSPSDGSERAVANGLAFTTPASPPSPSSL